MVRKFLVALVAIVIAGGVGLVGGGTVAAAPIPELTTTGKDFGTFGDHSFCHGAVRVTVDAPPRTRGVVRVTARSHGFTGQGQGWKRNPKCRIRFATLYHSASVINGQKWVTAAFGPKPGESKAWEVRTGSGPVSFTVSGYSANLPVAVPQAYGYGAYLLVP